MSGLVARRYEGVTSHRVGVLYRALSLSLRGLWVGLAPARVGFLGWVGLACVSHRCGRSNSTLKLSRDVSSWRASEADPRAELLIATALRIVLSVRPRYRIVEPLSAMAQGAVGGHV
mmetsp:Transcript_40292/g.87863  ORF Transcript_40292/g.87863 Transcript_40292/m.87863 type:complete len:117 (-) Transcript_40292:108-458(-)